MTNTTLISINSVKRSLNSCIGNLTVYNSTTDYINQAYLCVGNLQNTQKIPGYFRQGLLLSTNSSMDLGISGKGFFIVSDPSNTSLTLLTRDGSFSSDCNGYLTNAPGYWLQGYDLNQNFGNINIANVNPPLYNLATTNIKISANLASFQVPEKGAGETIIFPFAASNNYQISASETIATESNGAYLLNRGDYLNLTSSNNNIAHKFVYNGFVASNSISASILGASSVLGIFSGATDGWSFKITSQDYNIENFYFLTNSPNISLGQFNCLTNLAQAIDATYGFSARIVGNFLYMAPNDVTQNWNIIDVNGNFASNLFGATGSPATLTQYGSGNYFASLAGLANLVNNYTDIGAVVNDPQGTSSLSFYVTSSGANLIVAASSTGILTEFGLVGITPYSFSPIYDMSGITASNMAGGKILPHYLNSTRVYDSLGSSHYIMFSFLKLSTTLWSSELYLQNSNEINNGRNDGQIASGYVVFNGDGSLNQVSSSLSTININWNNGALPSTINVFLGTVGRLDGMTQLDSPYQMFNIAADGLAVGQYNGITIDINGNVNATYDNGANVNIYSVPLAYVTNTLGLTSYDTNILLYNVNLAGALNISSANDGSMGQIMSYSLEMI